MPRFIALVQAEDPRHRSGFTLIELLVAIAIIAIIAAMLMPGIASVRNSAVQTQCGSNLRQVYIGTMAYADDHQGALPPALIRTATHQNRFWYNWMAAYVDAGKPTSAYGMVIYIPERKTSVVWGCRSNPILRSDPSNGWQVGYGLNHQLGLPGSSVPSHRYPHTVPSNYAIFNVATLTYPSNRPLFGDSSDPAYFQTLSTPPRHRGRLSGVYCDGHVGYETQARWTALRTNPQNQ